MSTERLIFTGGWRNTSWTRGLVCGLPDHHGEILQGHRYHCTGDGECIDVLGYSCFAWLVFNVIFNLQYQYFPVELQKHSSASADDEPSLCFQMTKSVTCPEELGGLASQVTVDYGQLAHQGRLAAATAEPEEVRGHALCPVEYVGKITYSYVRFSCCIPLRNCAPEMSDWHISLGLHQKCFWMYPLTHWLEQIFAVLWYDTPSSLKAAPDSKIKQKYASSIHHSQDLHRFLKSFSVVQQCVEALH